eukprot:TRINITY_DN397_c0_g1_i1.p1 TRINITY_DN397_c0_g1~~TRINITY_DN397_c0_g1_i1.p1  ORF type:complete len:691 (-),score=129.93 TRINITY_DN397_c0_g1_i1:88-2160(-)
MSLLWRGSAALLVLLLAVAAVVVAKDGDRQLVQAFNAAFVRYKLNENDFITSSVVTAPLDCPVDETVYPFPEPKEDAALDLVLRSGRLKCGTPYLLPKPNFYLIVARLGTYYREHNPQRYGRSLTVEWVNYTSVDDMWNDLRNGSIDCASYRILTIGGFAGTNRRNTEWQPSCSHSGGFWYIVTESNSSIHNGTQLQQEMTRRWKQGIFYELASSSVEETQMWAQFPHAIVEQFQTVADTWFAHVGHPDSVLAASGAAPNVSQSQFYQFPLRFYPPAATFFRTEVEDQYKVRADEVDSLEPWQKGNENLAKLYEAALLALIQSGDYDNIFSNYPDEAGVSLLGSSQQGYLDCYMSGSMYPIPDFEFEWQSNSTNHTFFIAVSRSSSSPLLNTTTDPPKGPLHTLNFAVAAWISSQLFISPPLKLEYMFYDTDEDALDAVANGTAQATANNFWLATTYRGNASRDVFRPSCSSVAFETPLWCLSEAPFSRYWDLANKLYSSADCAGYSCKLGAVGALSQAVLRYRFPNITVELFSTTDDALWALRNSTSQVVAITPPLFSLVPPGVTMVQGFDSFQVFTTFFRKDYQSSCGDTELDAGKGEQCLYTDTTCTTNCTCRSGYHARNPVHNSCEKDTPITAIVLGTVLGSFAVVLILVVVGVVLAMLVLFPLLRKKYRREGMTNFRSRMFGHRW